MIVSDGWVFPIVTDGCHSHLEAVLVTLKQNQVNPWNDCQAHSWEPQTLHSKRLNLPQLPHNWNFQY